MEAVSESEVVTVDRFLQSDVRIALLRNETDRWLLPVAGLSAVLLHVFLTIAALEHWPDGRDSLLEPEVLAELIVEPPAPADESAPEPVAPPPQQQEFRQSGGESDFAPGGAQPEPEAQASAPPESAPDVADGAQPAISATTPSRPAPSLQQSPERAVARSESPANYTDDGKGGGDRYLNELRDIILKQRNYPLQQSGTAHYELVLDRAGSLLGATLVRTSGIGTLDDVGMGMIRRAAPFPPVPADMGGERIVVSLRLSLGPGGR
jgi:periplasmic protein TonB